MKKPTRKVNLPRAIKVARRDYYKWESGETDNTNRHGCYQPQAEVYFDWLKAGKVGTHFSYDELRVLWERIAFEVLPWPSVRFGTLLSRLAVGAPKRSVVREFYHYYIFEEDLT